MRSCKVEDSEKRLVFGATTPVCLSAGLVPARQRRVELLIGFDVVRAVITGCSEVFAEAFYIRRRHALAAHVVRADSGRIHPGDNARPCRGTNARVRIRVGVTHTLGRKGIDVRRYGVTISIAAQVRADVLATDPEDVWPLCLWYFNSIKANLG